MAVNPKGSVVRVTLAGLLAGLAEVIWVVIYGALAGGDYGRVAREIIATVMPGSAGSPLAPYVGLGLHFALSVGLVWLLYTIYRVLVPQASRPTLIALAAVVLTGIWAMNFFVILPHLNPVMADVLPKPVSLISKLLFGIAMALVLPLPTPNRARLAGGERHYIVGHNIDDEGITHGS